MLSKLESKSRADGRTALASPVATCSVASKFTRPALPVPAAHSPGAWSAIVIVAIVLVLTGCATTFPMMPTPALYKGENAQPLFNDLSIDSRRPSLDLLFITDRE